MASIYDYDYIDFYPDEDPEYYARYQEFQKANGIHESQYEYDRIRFICTYHGK